MHACNFGSVPSIHLCLNEECDDNYIICLESKGSKHRRTLLNKNIEVDVHYQVTNLFQETALEVFQEMQNGRFHETTAFLPFVSSVKKEIIKTIANMDGDKSIGNLSTNATATPSNNPQLISCNFTSYCSHGIALSRFLQTTTRSKYTTRTFNIILSFWKIYEIIQKDHKSKWCKHFKPQKNHPWLDLWRWYILYWVSWSIFESQKSLRYLLKCAEMFFFPMLWKKVEVMRKSFRYFAILSLQAADGISSLKKKTVGHLSLIL